MDESLGLVITQIHNARTMAAIAVTGAGSQAVAWLLSVPGASRTVLEVVIPYSRASLIDFLGHEPEQYVSPQAARALAAQAFRRAEALREEEVRVVGLGCTGTIVTDRPKRGEHRAYVAAQTSARTITYALTLNKGARDRAGEEEVVSRVLLRALAQACGVSALVDLQLQPFDRLEVTRADAIQRLLAAEIRSVSIYPDGHKVEDELLPAGTGVLPGSFNPLHAGHVRLAQTARHLLDREVVFELSVRNVDKQPLHEDEIRQRVAQFSLSRERTTLVARPRRSFSTLLSSAGGGEHFPARVVLTDAPLIADKATLFPGCTFVIGYDTAARLLDPAYYEGEESAMIAALDTIQKADCRLLVAGRLVDGVYRTLADLSPPAEFQHLFQAIPEGLFRMDISSTEIRGQRMEQSS
jgi:cytidyltransferase-like protein